MECCSDAQRGALTVRMINVNNESNVIDTIRTAHAMLDGVTPLKGNCGKLCGAVCCQADESGENGMLLLPFEQQLYQTPIENFPFHLVDDNRLYIGGKRMVCEGRCVRELRPFACRIFPLRNRIAMGDNGQVTGVTPEIDPGAWVVCPLPEEGGLRAMNPVFIRAVKAAGELLCKNADILAALLSEQRTLDEMRTFF